MYRNGIDVRCSVSFAFVGLVFVSFFFVFHFFFFFGRFVCFEFFVCKFSIEIYNQIHTYTMGPCNIQVSNNSNNNTTKNEPRIQRIPKSCAVISCFFCYLNLICHLFTRCIVLSSRFLSFVILVISAAHRNAFLLIFWLHFLPWTIVLQFLPLFFSAQHQKPFFYRSLFRVFGVLYIFQALKFNLPSISFNVCAVHCISAKRQTIRWLLNNL